jgi:hypothetical protein
MMPVDASYRDPGYGVLTDDTGKRFFRLLPHEPEVYNSHPFFPGVLSRVEGNLYEVERIRFMNHFHEWTFSQCKDSALFHLDILESLIREGWMLRDAHPTNITYEGKGMFRFIDHGSLERYDGAGWQAHLQFIREYAYPLQFLSTSPIRSPQSLVPVLMDKSWQIQYRPPLSKRLSLGYRVLRSSLLLSQRKSLKDTGSSERKQKVNPRYSIAFLRDFIKSLKIHLPRTKWGDYYERTILEDGYLERKTSAVETCVSKVADRVSFSADFGASSGRITTRLSDRFRNIRFIAIESDPNASEELYLASRSSDVIPINSNILQLTPALGFDGSYASLDERLRNTSDLNLALGIIHHMMHEENLPFERIIRYFKERSKPGSYLVIEYVGPGDPRYRLIRNPNYPHAEDIASFEDALRIHYKILHKESVHDERTLYLAEAE